MSTDELVRFTLTVRARCATRAEVAAHLRHLANMAESVTRIDDGFDGVIDWSMWCDPVTELEPNE